jgi:hypothetical protein
VDVFDPTVRPNIANAFVGVKHVDRAAPVKPARIRLKGLSSGKSRKIWDVTVLVATVRKNIANVFKMEYPVASNAIVSIVGICESFTLDIYSFNFLLLSESFDFWWHLSFLFLFLNL